MLLLLMQRARARSTQLVENVLLRPARERIENGKQTGRECTECKHMIGGKYIIYIPYQISASPMRPPRPHKYLGREVRGAAAISR